MNDKHHELRKARIIKRLVSYSFVYEKMELEKLSIKQLIFLQKSTFVELNIIIIYRRRHNKTAFI